MRIQKQTGTIQKYSGILSKCLPIGLIVLMVARVLIGLRIPYWILADQFYDDRMMFENALNIVNGAWLGDYDAYALTKGISYSVFMLLAKKLCIPYSLLLAGLNVFSAYLFAAAISPVIKNKYARAVIYVLLLFSPINLTMYVTQRLYRMAIIPCMVEIVFAGMIGLFLRKNSPLKEQLMWSLLAGGSLAFFWQIREDSIWILPFVIVITAMNIFYYIFVSHEKMRIRRILITVLPVVILLVGNLGTAGMNKQHYGVFTVNDRTGGSFGEMMSLLYKMDGAEVTDDIWISKDVIHQAEEVSDTLRQVKPVLDKYIDDWAKGEEIRGDHYSWVIRGAVEDSGYVEDAVAAENFYAQIVEELTEAIDAGEIKLKEDGRIYFSSQARGILPGEIPELLEDALFNIWEISGYIDCGLNGSLKSTGTVEEIRRIEAFTSVLGIYNNVYRFSADGWIFAKNNEHSLSVVLSTVMGKEVQGVVLRDSVDVAEMYPQYENAKKARFAVEQTSEQRSEYGLDIYLDGKHYITLSPETYEDEFIVLNVENVANETLFDYSEEYSRGAVALGNKLNQCYQLAGKPCFVLALLCYGLLMIYVICGMTKRRYDCLEIWIVITGVILSAVLLRFGNSLFTGWFTEGMQKFINSFYSCGVYILLQIFKYLSIATFGSAVYGRIKGRKHDR